MHGKAAILFSALDSHDEAGEAYKKAGEYEKAAKAFSLAGRHRDAALLYEKHDSDEEAVAEWKAFVPDDHEGRVKKVRSIYDIQWKLLKRRPTKEKTYDQAMANALFDEASDCRDAGDYLNALAIMIQFKEKEPVLDCLAHVADDMLAAYIISFSGDYAQWTEYRKGRRTITLNPLKAADYLSSSFSYMEKPKKASVNYIDGFLLFLKDISSFAGTMNLELLRAALELPLAYCDECFNRDRSSILRWGNDLFQILAALKSYDRIISVGSTWHVSRASDKDIEKLIDSLDDLAVSRGDDILRLCKATIKGQNVAPAVLENATVDMNTWSILRCYTSTKEKVVDFLVGKMLIVNAAECLASFGEFSRAAELLEKHKLLNDAASYYERAQDWQKAEAIYARGKDAKSIARLYEHKGDFSTAISHWKKLGYPKQVERLEKKMKKLNTKPAIQGTLELGSDPNY
jgi:tetratricopeptide (TPR) repeat protein